MNLCGLLSTDCKDKSQARLGKILHDLGLMEIQAQKSTEAAFLHEYAWMGTGLWSRLAQSAGANEDDSVPAKTRSIKAFWHLVQVINAVIVLPQTHLRFKICRIGRNMLHGLWDQPTSHPRLLKGRRPPRPNRQGRAPQAASALCSCPAPKV